MVQIIPVIQLQPIVTSLGVDVSNIDLQSVSRTCFKCDVAINVVRIVG